MELQTTGNSQLQQAGMKNWLVLFLKHPTIDLVKAKAHELIPFTERFPNVVQIIQESPEISVLAARIGKDKVQMVLSMLISDFDLSLNTFRRMTTSQIAGLALDMMADYPGYRMEDFICFFHLAKQGKLNERDKWQTNEVKDRIDVQVIYGLLRAYESKRTEQIEEAQINTHKALKSGKLQAVENPAAKVKLKKGDLSRMLDREPTLEEIEERLGRKISHSEWHKAQYGWWGTLHFYNKPRHVFKNK